MRERFGEAGVDAPTSLTSADFMHCLQAIQNVAPAPALSADQSPTDSVPWLHRTNLFVCFFLCFHCCPHQFPVNFNVMHHLLADVVPKPWGPLVCDKSRCWLSESEMLEARQSVNLIYCNY